MLLKLAVPSRCLPLLTVLSAPVMASEVDSNHVSANVSEQETTASETGFWQRAKTTLSTTWNASQSYDLYVPAIT